MRLRTRLYTLTRARIRTARDMEHSQKNNFNRNSSSNKRYVSFHKRSLLFETGQWLLAGVSIVAVHPATPGSLIID